MYKKIVDDSDVSILFFRRDRIINQLNSEGSELVSMTNRLNLASADGKKYLTAGTSFSKREMEVAASDLTPGRRKVGLENADDTTTFGWQIDCFVNAKNSYRGYTGMKPWRATFVDGRLVDVSRSRDRLHATMQARQEDKMPRADKITNGVSQNERFNIDIFAVNYTERPVNANRELPGLPYDITTHDDATVTEWKKRFAVLYPGYTAEINRPDGGYHNGRTYLRTVRGT